MRGTALSIGLAAMGYEGTTYLLRFFTHFSSRYSSVRGPFFPACVPSDHVYAACITSCTRRPLHTTTVLDAPPPKKGPGGFKAGMTVTKKKFNVETDPHKLVNYLCGGQYMKEGPEVKLKPDSEYPDWLWTLRTDGAVPLHEMNPGTIEYWERVKALQLTEHRRQLKAVKGKHWLVKMAQRKRRREEIQQERKDWYQGQKVPSSQTSG